jgi:hypothetical protein
MIRSEGIQKIRTMGEKEQTKQPFTPTSAILQLGSTYEQWEEGYSTILYSHSIHHAHTQGWSTSRRASLSNPGIISGNQIPLDQGSCN